MGARHGSGSNKCVLDEQDPSLMSFNTLHTIMLHAKKVSLERCAISELGQKVSELFGVLIIKAASHHSAPCIYLHAMNIIIIGSSIIFKIWWISTMPYHSRITLCWISTSQRVTWITAVSASWPVLLSSPRHGACAYPTLTSDDKNIQLENLGLKRVASETSRLLRQMYPSQLDSLRPENATKGSRHQQ